VISVHFPSVSDGYCTEITAERSALVGMR